MMDRVLRWLSVISLGLLALSAAWVLGELPEFAVRLRFMAGSTPVYIVGYLLLPATTTAICEVAGITTFALCIQRKQWGWFVGILLALIVHFYASVLPAFPGALAFLVQRVGSPFRLSIYLTLYYTLALTPLTVLALVYAWTRPQPTSARAAISPSPANSR